MAGLTGAIMDGSQTFERPDIQRGGSEEPLGIAIVTGAASGIGEAVARKLASENWTVHICDIDANALKRFSDRHPNIHTSVASVSNPADVQSVVQGVLEKHGRIDALINNAGISGMTAPVEEFDIEDWRRTIEINVNGSFYFVREVVPAMKAAGKGAIINIASTAALFGYPQRSAYAAAKWAILGFTKTLAMELGPFGIRANAICPGSVEGPRIDGVIERDAAKRGVKPEDVRRVYEGQVSMRKFVSADDIANMCAFLASGQSRFVSGQVIAVDGHTESLSFPF
jgi:NAD(P)-dependent dehydrogenase (short-subunit alcohol dehydrogenase family)